MDVFLVPVGPDGYELYCEEPETPPEDPRGRWLRWLGIRWLIVSFRQMLASAERERRARLSGVPVAEPTGWWGRLKARMLRWAAETMAEQRLLWHLRRCAVASLKYPDDTSAEDASRALRAHLTRDYDKHRRWLIIDLLGFIGSGALALVPGPNLLAYYFAFRLVGHFLSLRGARQGLDVATWEMHPCAELREVREVIADGAPNRADRLRAIQERLRLEHFASYVERVVYSAN
jgi:hypothetical protein